MADVVLDLFHRKSSRGVEGMESVVATVSGYHGSDRFNLIKLISQTGANYVGAMSKSITHLVCWKFEGKKYGLAKKFRTTLVVSPKWFVECAKSGKRVPEDPYIMECGEEVGTIQFDGLLMEKDNLPTRTQRNILADGTDWRENSEELADDHCHSNARKTAPLITCFLEQDIYPSTSLRLRSPELNIKKRKGRQSSSKNHFRPLLSPLAGDEGHESSSLYCQRSHRQKRNTFHSTSSRISAETSCKGRRLVKKNVARTILESDILDSDQDCSFIGSSGSGPGSTSESHHLHEITEDQMDLSISLSPRKFNLRNDSAIDVINCQDNAHGDATYTSQHNQTARQHTPAEPSCAICWTDFSITRGILPCGHRYCYPCIQNWSDQLALKGKVSTCPLCKEAFCSILKVDDDVASDQKVYSQTIPCAPLVKNISILPVHGLSSDMTQFLTGQTCSMCHSREPEESLESCHVCKIRHIHLYCLDPPLLPWVCVRCRELQNVFQRG
uniref:RING-type E3 ubiquitin transferase BRCA1 n=1 Tax=Kalanchoe fedtschenkoi TaxID=63787 RepID=A0A7N0UUP7_KALFE